MNPMATLKADKWRAGQRTYKVSQSKVEKVVSCQEGGSGLYLFDRNDEDTGLIGLFWHLQPRCLDLGPDDPKTHHLVVVLVVINFDTI